MRLIRNIRSFSAMSLMSHVCAICRNSVAVVVCRMCSAVIVAHIYKYTYTGRVYGLSEYIFWIAPPIENAFSAHQMHAHKRDAPTLGAQQSETNIGYIRRHTHTSTRTEHRRMHLYTTI